MSARLRWREFKFKLLVGSLTRVTKLHFRMEEECCTLCVLSVALCTMLVRAMVSSSCLGGGQS